MGKLAWSRLPTRSAHESEEDGWAGFPPTERKHSALFVVAEQYSEHERLDELIEAVMLAVVRLRTVAAAALQGMARVGASQSFVFEPEAKVRGSYALSAEALDAGQDASSRLEALLNELRGGPTRADQSQPSH